MALSKIWVLAESFDGKVSTPTLELLTKARELGDTVEAVYGGADADVIAAELGAHGATKVLATGDLGGALAGVPVASAIAALVEAGNGPDAILFATSYDGRDVAGRLSVKLDKTVLTNNVGLEVDVAGRLSVKLDKTVLTNNVDLEADGDALVTTEPVFGGQTNVKTKFTGAGPFLVLVRPKSFAAEPSGGGAAAVESIAVPEAGQAKITNRHIEEREGPSLDDASIVVSGGRGLGEADKYSLIEDLAKLLSAAPGASRAIVDAGWVPYSYQVGQTGKVVKPTVYIAAGISGATQHMVGMKGSKNIIAINKDAEAPIFGISDLGIVGDVHKVLPALIEALKARG